MTQAAAKATVPPPRRLPPEDFELKEILLHGHRVAYRSAGSGPAIVLVHGITSNSATWERVMPYLATRFTVIAPDLIGHGESAKPRGDYSLGAYSSGIRDLMVALGHESATFVGHSLGGGVAMQLAYQFPERCERLVLVDSGGLGREVSFLLRAATLPFSEIVLPLLAHTRLLDAGRVVGRTFGRVGLHASSDMSVPACSPTRPNVRPTTRPASSRRVWASRGSTISENGRVAARSRKLTSRPSPPLSTSTSRSQRSGNWYASCMATPPPREWPTKVALSCPSATIRSRIPLE